MVQILKVSDLSKNKLVKIANKKKTMYCKVAYKEQHDTLHFLKSNKSIKNIIDSAVIYKIEFQIIYPFSEVPFTDFPGDGLNKSDGRIFYSYDILEETNDIFTPILRPNTHFRVFESSKDEIQTLISREVEKEIEKNQDICRKANEEVKDKYAIPLKLL